MKTGKNAALEFLSLLDCSEREFTFQTFDNDKKRNDLDMVGLHHGSLDELDYLEVMNDMGAAVSVTINETDGKGRKKENIKRVRAVWCDDDCGYADGFPLPQSAIVMTRPNTETEPAHYHHYWFVHDELSPEAFEDVMRVMVEKYGCDPQARDINRAMRLPGFLGKDNYRTKLIHSSVARYTAAQLQKAFKARKTVAEAKVESSTYDPYSAFENNKDRILDALGCISPDDRGEWREDVGAALHYSSAGSEEAFTVFDEWSSKSEKYQGTADIRNEWNGYRLDHPNPKTLGSLFDVARKYGWTGEVDRDLKELEPPPEIYIEAAFGVVGRPLNEITTKALANVRKLNEERKHYPSEDQYKGLEQIAKVIEAMALRVHEHPQTPNKCPELDGGYFVSFLPCGVGKTTVLQECTKTILSLEPYESIGIIIFLHQCDMIEAMVEDMKLSEDQYAVIVSENGPYAKLNFKGVQGDKTHARVLFTTQQKLEHLSKEGKSFKGMSELHFNGVPRQVRVWDEAILPSEMLTLPCIKIMTLLEKLNELSPDLSNDLWEFGNTVKELQVGEAVEVPNFTDYGVTLDKAVKAFKERGDKQAVQTLFTLQGKTARVARDNAGNTMIQYADILPADLAPLLILDASGGQRATYKLWHHHRKGIQFLYSPNKSYDGFTIHHWDRGAGKKAINKGLGEPDKLAEGVARTINAEVPQDKNCLVVYHKPDDENDDKALCADLAKEIARRLSGEKERVKYLTWGRHTATNDYSDYEYVFLVGVLQYSMPTYEVTGLAAKGARIEEKLTKEEIEDIKLGEAYHNILQATCRGKVRKSEGDGCPRGCHLYIVYSSSNLPIRLLGRIFPDSNTIKWAPLPPNLTPKKKKLFDELMKVKGRSIVIDTLMKHTGERWKNNLIRDLENETLLAHLKEKGWVLEIQDGAVKVVKDWAQTGF